MLVTGALLASTASVQPASGQSAPIAPSCAVSSLYLIPTSNGGQLGVSWRGCGESDGAAKPTGYRVTARTPFLPGPDVTYVVDMAQSSHQVRLDVPAPQILHVTVTPYNGAGDSTAPRKVLEAIAPHPNVEDFVREQLRDGFGVAPADSVREIAAILRSGSESPLDLVVEALEQGRGAVIVEPLVRLYRAYFLRDPDASGLVYWIKRREAGEQLGPVSTSFAASSEFRRRYGSLSNAAFVARIYQNVLGRAPDAAGQRYWTGRLDSKRIDRGRLMVQFSESAEYRRRSDLRVEPTAVTVVLLGRRPRGDEWKRWANLRDPLREAAADIIAGGEYAGRVLRQYEPAP